VLKAIAFGGEETGRNMAEDADSAMMSATSALSPGRIAMPRGIITVLAAVLLMIFETSMVTKARIDSRITLWISMVISL
jgi:hypothetical protein